MVKHRLCSTFPATKAQAHPQSYSWQDGGFKTRLIGTPTMSPVLPYPSFVTRNQHSTRLAATGGRFLFHFEHYTTQIVALCASEPTGEDAIALPVGVHVGVHKPRG
jgi:hypothetical protein